MHDMVNVSRLHALMDEQRLSAVIVRSGKNITYLSGVVFPGTLARHLDLAELPSREPARLATSRGPRALLRSACRSARLEGLLDRPYRVFVSLESRESSYRGLRQASW